MKDPTVKERSQVQMDAMITVLTDTRDIMIAMKTGGGKSMLWMVPSVLDEEAKCIVVCPFVALLEEQYAKATATGLRCHNYSRSKDVLDNVQVLFLQVKHCSSERFASFLMSPLGKKFGRVFIDKFHDISNCRPNHTIKWKVLAKQFTTAPPHCLALFLKPFGIKVADIAKPITVKQSLNSLVHALNRRLRDEEHMLMFFASQGDAQLFVTQNRCAVYHSKLFKPGNTKAYDLDLWDRGESKVMVCTTAFAQGMDRCNVQYVVIFRPAYRLIVNNQMLGHAGRDREESHVFFVTDAEGITSFHGGRTGREHCMEELHNVEPAPVQPTSQDSDSMYDDFNSQITSSQARALDAMEDIHQPRPSTKESNNPFMSALQPSAPTSSRVELPPPSSLPSNHSRSFAARAGRSKNFNGKQPACHTNMVYKKGMGSYSRRFSAHGKQEKFRKLLVQDIGGGATLSTLDEFIDWVVQEQAEEGKYINCFLWFCGEIEKAKPHFFM
ncbi:P-loop containing nucleoside triphosphate hydrolase protein [Suillus subalutaceus]|uniref:P-loop containing nucleoside triphosphate hydrolase protein n=1 Tax=Suillus subalutaceus TaxID=48586 RepID=UPI001B86C5A8|nr:P-loop containing nucleoside triphosphate hydrolase protein [Suillus subalutaceus]KAG1837982.1 P-loop containing nucleoside triphosphate hydrolase protein [Suillus subalutaceus]